MKRYLFIIVTCAMLLSTGCAASQIELTQEENDMIAEYIAGVMLKHDLAYNHKLLYNGREEEAAASPSPSAATEPSPTEKPSEGKDASSASAEPEKVYQPLNDIYKSFGVKTTFEGAKIASSYPEKPENGYSVEAKKGKKILILTFRLQNTKKKENSVLLSGSHITYHLKDAGNNTLKPLLTALPNDLQYFEIKLADEQKALAVLTFEIPEGAKLKDYSLEITKDKMKSKIDLK